MESNQFYTIVKPGLLCNYIGLWCLMPLSTIFQLHVYIWWQVQEKTTDLSQITDTFPHNVVLSSPCLSGIRTHNVNDDRH